jgi:hypothetical protein
LLLGSVVAEGAAERSVRTTGSDAATPDFRPPWAELCSFAWGMPADGLVDVPLTRVAIGACGEISPLDGAASGRRLATASPAVERPASRARFPIRLAPAETPALAAPTAEDALSPVSRESCIASGARDDGPICRLSRVLEPPADADGGASVPGPPVVGGWTARAPAEVETLKK